MNFIKTRKILLIVFTIAILLSCSMLFLSLGQSNRETTVQASEANFSVEIRDTYALNEKVNFKSEVNVEYDGQSYLAGDGAITYPNGASYLITDKEMTLDVSGKYLLKYFSQSKEFGRIAFTKEFSVNSAYYYVTGNNGSSVTAVSGYNMDGDINDVLDIDNDITVGKQDGLIVRLNNGSKFVYSKPIDLRDANDNGLTDIIKLDPRMHDVYVDDVGHTMLSPAVSSRLVVTLTDAYNPDVYIKIIMHSNGGNLYFRASSSTLTEKGIEWPYTGNFTDHNGVRNVIYYDGIKGLIWHGSYGGHANNFNLNKRIVVKDESGNNVNKWVANDRNCDGVTLSMDFEEAKLYVSSTNYSTKDVDTTLFADFLNSDFYDTDLYQRFTTGEAFVSVEYVNYDLAGSARFDVFSIGKDNAQFLMDGISYEDDGYGYIDDVAPIIDVDFQATEYGRVYATVGDVVKIPSATATDINLAGDVKVSVYRGDENLRKHVNVYDGKFKVSSEELYYVQYTAKDFAGNVGKKTIIIQGVSAKDGKVLNLDIDSMPTALTLGKSTEIPMPKVSTLNNENSLKLKIEIVSEKQNVVLAEFNGMKEIEQFSGDFSFIPLFTGDYKILYRCMDNGTDYWNEPIEFVLNCSSSDDVYFETQPFLQKYLIKDAKYSFDVPTAYKYVSGEKIKVSGTNLYVSFDGGEYTKVSNELEVLITGAKTAQFKVENGNAVMYSEIAEIVDVNYADRRNLIIQNYFVGDFTVDTEDENGELLRDLLFKSNVKDGANKLSFVNIIDVNEFNLEYAVLDGYDNFGELNIILTDPYNLKNKIVLTIYKEFGLVYFSVNGGKAYVVNRSFADPALSLGYSDVTGLIYVSGITGGVAHKIDFTNDVAYLEIELAEITGDSAIQITGIGNQPLKLGARDTQAPVGHAENPSGSFALGSVVTINPSKFYDVLSAISYKNGTLSVSCNGEFVQSADGVILDGSNNDANRTYEIVLNSYGEYEVLYEIKDGFGVRGSTISLFNVVDTIAPTITLDSELKDGCIVKLDVGKNLNFGYTVEDDVTSVEKLTVYVTVRNLKSNHVDVYPKTNFVFKEKGEYEISVACLDESGNYSRCTFKVVVGGEK